MNCFVNYIEELSNSDDTAHRYPENLKRISEYEDIKTSTNNIKLNKYVIGLLNRASQTRYHKYLKSLSNKSILPIKKIRKADVSYFSYVYPFNIYHKLLKNSVIRINYQTDRVLKWRGKKDINKYRYERGKKLGKFDCVMTTTKHSVEKIKNYLPSSETTVRYCPNFLPYLNTATKLKNNQKGNRIKILFVGGDGHRKGLKNFLKAVQEIKNKHKKRISITVVSKYDPKINLELVKLNKYNSLKKEDVIREMKSSNIFCMPTKSDSYGIVYIEAMSMGCAILSDDDITRKEIVENNEVGLCVDPNNVEEITKSIEKLVQDRRSRRKYMENARSVFEKKFSPRVVAKKHHDIFRSVIQDDHD
ncbi:glycosyltransferase family 4 protein [Salinibacter ruber]|uniref:glycosyltransferase family 4 protein n=1 Tax=Salinibacter ruber TaxID=146919 RepID=UPI002168B97B|nr:glycosyltransferase family 4 protein [Salinibacter ruber]MCS4040860.1 glycosyltransferase involved in cell wall biosynthesis [Salinibacter ruber]